MLPVNAPLKPIKEPLKPPLMTVNVFSAGAISNVQRATANE